MEFFKTLVGTSLVAFLLLQFEISFFTLSSVNSNVSVTEFVVDAILRLQMWFWQKFSTFTWQSCRELFKSIFFEISKVFVHSFSQLSFFRQQFLFPVSISSFECSPLLLTNVCGYQAFCNKNKETRYFCTEFLKHPQVDFSVVNL